MEIFYYFLYIYLLSVCEYKKVLARSIYDTSHVVEREDNAPVLSSYSKKKLLKDELARGTKEDSDNDVIEAPNSLYDTPRFRQYDPAEMYVHQAPRMLSRSNGDYPTYDVKKREYYPDMKTGRDTSLEVVLDPKARKAVALLDNSEAQDNYDLSGWKNSKDDAYGYDNEQYSQGNRDQVVNLIYPVSRADRMSIRNNIDAAGALDSSQSLNQNKNVRNIQDYDNQGQLVYKATINEPERTDIISQKFKRHVRTKKRESNEKYNSKSDAAESDERNSEMNAAHEISYDTENEENIDKQSNSKTKKRSNPNWSNEQITALKDSLAMLQENSGEYENLKTILSDMGLVENNAIKRETNSNEDESEIVEKEDENLSANDITMMKNDKKWISNVEDAPQETLDKRELHDKIDDVSKKQFKKRADKLVYKKNMESNGPDKQHNDDENDNNIDSERKKRDSETNVNSPDNNSPDIMKGLEKSGELTLSGNKSPLASDEKSESDTIGNERMSRTATEKDILDKRHINEGDEDYEQKIETEIQAKIDAIKEKVKREIMMQKQKQKYHNTRKKREATLLDSENQNINPEYIAGEVLEPHIRTRRKINMEQQTEKTLEGVYQLLNKDNTLNNGESSSNLKQTSSILTNKILEPHIRSRRDISNQEKISVEKTKNLSKEQVAKRQIKKSSGKSLIADKDVEKIQTKEENEDEEDIKKEDSEETFNIPSAQQNIIERKKRANNILPEHKMVFRPYLSAQDEEEEGEGGEFDNAYDQTYVEKREAYEPDYQYFENKESESNQEYQSPEKIINNMDIISPEQRYRRSHTNYVADLNYGQQMSQGLQSKYLQNMPDRNKRDNENAQLHGGGMISSRKSTLKNKAIQEDRDKRGNSQHIENSEQDESDNSENDFFGALPQNYQEGELNRYKRIKRDDQETKSIDVT